MTREENIRAILECNFSGTKEELIDIAVKNIMALLQEPTVTSTDEPMTMVYPTIVCDDAINRQAVKDILNNSYSLTDAEHRVEQLPSVTQKPDKYRKEAKRWKNKWLKSQKSGKWITKPHVYGVTYCSECDFELKIDDTNYCPNCGAKMVEPQERSDKE